MARGFAAAFLLPPAAGRAAFFLLPLPLFPVSGSKRAVDRAGGALFFFFFLLIGSAITAVPFFIGFGGAAAVFEPLLLRGGGGRCRRLGCMQLIPISRGKQNEGCLLAEANEEWGDIMASTQPEDLS